MLVEFLKMKFLRNCDAFVVPGKSSIEYLRTYGVSEELIFTAPNAVDTQLFARKAAVVRRRCSHASRGFGLAASLFSLCRPPGTQKKVFSIY